MYETNELLDRFCLTLERERVRINYSQTRMAKAIGVPLASYKCIINCENSKLGINTIYQLHALTGKVINEFFDIPSPINECLPLLRNLSEKQINFIRNVICFEISSATYLKKDEPAKNFATLIIPTGNMHDGMIYDSCNLKKIDISAYRCRYGPMIDCALLITSPHMQPAYQQNDVLLISCGPLHDGDTGIFIDNYTGRIFFRKYFQAEPIRMEPVVSYGHTFLIDSTSSEDTNRWTRIGYVITKMTPNQRVSP